MKLSVITNEQKIKDTIRLLYDNLSVYSERLPIEIDYGSPGGREKIEVYFSETKDFWWGSKVEKDKNKYWNPVGFGEPNISSLTTSDCEFNCYLNGFNKKSSCFAKDNAGNTYLLHTGKAGGNTPGTSIDGFCEFYKEAKRQPVIVDKEMYLLFIVSDINSNNLLDNIIKYASAIYAFKKDLKAKMSGK